MENYDNPKINSFVVHLGSNVVDLFKQCFAFDLARNVPPPDCFAPDSFQYRSLWVQNIIVLAARVQLDFFLYTFFKVSSAEPF